MTHETRAFWVGNQRLAGLRRFGLAITVLNVLGHTVLGFEQALAVPFVAVAAAYVTELLLETIDAAAQHRRARWRGGLVALVDFLLPAHISGLAVGMLLYTNARLGPVVCAAVIAIASKNVLRIARGDGSCHVFNPSNLGITATLLMFPWVGIAPPYQFTENLDGIGDWVLPAVIVVLGSLLNAKFTHRVPVIIGWLSGFVVQAVIRAAVADAGIVEVLRPALTPVSGVAFLLFTFYMAPDPATTPSGRRAQFAFGAGVAGAYGLLMAWHVVFGLFLALTAASTVRALAILVGRLVSQRVPAFRALAPVWRRSRSDPAFPGRHGSDVVS